MKHRMALLLLISSVVAVRGIAEAGPRSVSSPWFLAFALSPEGFGGDLGLSEGERMSASLVLDPLPWKSAVPSVSVGLSVPLFPWMPEETLLEARLDLRLLTLRAKRSENRYNESAEYAPALSASIYVPVSGDDAFASLGIRPFAFRTGDAVYSFFSTAVVVSRGGDPAETYGFRGFSVELFEFVYFFM